MSMIAFDTETTGLIKPDDCDLNEQPRIIEFYAAEFNMKGKIISEFETFINPDLPIPEFITKLTGIDDAMIADAPRFIEVYDDIADFFVGKNTVFVHNCAFDMGMLRIELERHGLQYMFPYPPYQCCTVEASFCIENKRLKMEKLYQIATGKEKPTKHRARDDVENLIEIVCWLKKEGFIHELFS